MDTNSIDLAQALLIPAFLGSTMFTSLIIISCLHYGTDRHIWDVPLTKFESTALMAWLSELAFLVSTCSTKVSVLLFFRRLTAGTYSKRWRWATIAAIVFTICYFFAFLFALIFNCRPTEAYWKAFSFDYTEKYHCTNTKFLNPVSGALSVFSDFYSVILPVGMLRHFETDRRKKLALNAVFSLGLLVVAAGSVRTYYLARLGTGYDITWIGFNVYIWSDLEVQLAIICASAPVLRVLFRRYLKDPLSRARHTASNVSGSGFRSAQRDSKPPEQAAVNSFSQTRESQDSSGSSDKKLVRHSIKPSLVTVGEQETETSTWSRPKSEPFVIRNAADFEAYALDNLEKGRAHARKASMPRPPSDMDMKSTLSEPFSGDLKTPRSWLDDDKD